MDLESSSVQLPLHLYLHSAELKYLKKHTDNPILSNMINAWYEVKNYKSIPDSLSGFIQSGTMSNLHLVNQMQAFVGKKGLGKIQDLYVGEVLMTFEELSNIISQGNISLNICNWVLFCLNKGHWQNLHSHH